MSSATARFRVHGTVVTGAGTTPPGQGDHFYGSAGTGYAITIEPGADLFGYFAISKDGQPGPGTTAAPNGELVTIDHGSITNDGSLNVYPASTDPPGSHGCRSCLTAGVVLATGASGAPASVVNSGVIGDRVLGSAYGGQTTEHGYGQVDEFGVSMTNGTVVNEPGGTITGYNGVVTSGTSSSDVLTNYGIIDATHVAVLSSFLIVNHAGGAINTGLAGFACIHADGDVANYGYLLGQDYGMLLQGTRTWIADYGGGRVPGVVNFDGASVHNGEISAIFRSTGKINSDGPYLSGDAVMMDTEHSTFTLHTTVSSGRVWLPVINGPMVGGFEGDSDSPSAHRLNTLAFNFTGISSHQIAGLRSAVARSAARDARGIYFSGLAVVRGHTYHWVDWASVTVDGRRVAPQWPERKAAASATPAPGPRAAAVSAASRAAALQQPADVAGMPWVDVTAIVLLFAVLAAIMVRSIRRRPARAGPRTPASHSARSRPRD